MGYVEAKQKISSYVMKNGSFIELTPGGKNIKQYYQELETFSNGKKLAIRYPGYKATKEKSDYCVYLVDKENERAISHKDIMKDLYEKTTKQNYESMKRYIENVAVYGDDMEILTTSQDIDNSGFSYEELTSLMFYIAIQEDINYPEKKYLGRKMCFYRYLEAIYCKVHNNHSLDEALERAVERSIPKLWKDAGNLYDVVSGIKRE